MIASKLNAAVAAVAPIIGVSIGQRDDKNTWRIDFAPDATQAERDAAAAVITSFDVAAAESAEQLKTVALDSLAGEIRSDNIFKRLENSTGAEIGDFVDTTFSEMKADQREVLTLLLRFTALRLGRG